MSGRYAFSLPEPRQRDGWFRIGSIDVTTTALIVGIGLCSMVLYAIDRDLTMKGAFSSPNVRDGELWRLVTWPLTNPPVDIWALLSLAVFWFLGHQVEDRIGRVPYTWLVAAMTVIPAILVSLIDVTNDQTGYQWSAYTFSVWLLWLGMVCIFGLDQPDARFWPGIPAWVIAAALVFIEVLRDLGDRQFAQLILLLAVIVVGAVGARQRGMCDVLSFVPRWTKLAPASPYATSPNRSSRRHKAPKRPKADRGPAVVQGPWGAPSGGPTPLEQAELDVLLDRISEGGIDSLTPQEKARLNELSRRMRES